jgi:hypothetical protein
MGKSKQLKSLSLAAIFFAFFILLISISIVLKIVNVYQKSTFDGENHFTVSVISKSDKVSLVSFAPKSNQIYILNINGGKDKNLRTTLEIPIDSEIYADSEITEENIKTNFFKFLSPFGHKKTNLTVFDLFRLWAYANSVPTNSIYQQEILANDDSLKLKSLGIYSYFVDQKIAEEKISIEVVNGTGVFGLGNKLASFLSNTGANIVMVSTSEKEENSSRIDYFKKESYTLKKLVRVLGFKTKMTEKKSLGDITITIGKDTLGKIRF